MHRRRFIALLGGAIAPPCIAAAQQKAMPVIGFLSVFSPPTDPGEIGRGPVLQGLNQTGFVEGQNISIERCWAEGDYDRLPAMAADLVIQYKQTQARGPEPARPEPLSVMARRLGILRPL